MNVPDVNGPKLLVILAPTSLIPVVRLDLKGHGERGVENVASASKDTSSPNFFCTNYFFCARDQVYWFLCQRPANLITESCS